VLRKNNGQFTSEGLKDNKFAVGNKPNKTSFHKWHLPHNFKDGVQVMTNDCVYVADLMTKKRIRRPVKVWTEVNGCIPKGWVVFHLDGDSHNDDISNLCLLNRKGLLDMNRYGVTHPDNIQKSRG